MDAEKKLKIIKDQIKWAEEEIKRPEYKDDQDSINFFKGIIFLKKFIEE